MPDETVMARQLRSSRETNLRLDQFLPFVLSTATNAVSNLISRTYHSRFGLSIPEWRIVAVLAESGALTQQDLCDRTIMDKVTISRATQALVGRNLASRTPNSNDGRSHLLELTAEGQRLVDDIAPAALAMEQTLFETFTAKEKKTFATLLNRVHARATALDKG